MFAKTLQCILRRTIWYLPARFHLAALLGPRYSLRCVLFHDIAEQYSVFTDGLRVTLSEREFEAKIQFLVKHYTPVSLDEVISQFSPMPSSRNPVLITFDDAYTSVAERAAPICQKYGIEPVFFVNAGFVGNHDLGMDNLLCYVANTLGIRVLNKVAHDLFQRPSLSASLVAFIGDFLPTLSLGERATFRSALLGYTRVSSKELAAEAKLYVTPDQLHALAADGFEIGSHTYSHVHCRVLSTSDFGQEIEGNKQCLEAMLGRTVRAFSVPYGSREDLGKEFLAHLKNSGHSAAFLAESRSNCPQTNLYHLNRVSLGAGKDSQVFCDIEILPRLRSLRDRFLT